MFANMHLWSSLCETYTNKRNEWIHPVCVGAELVQKVLLWGSFSNSRLKAVDWEEELKDTNVEGGIHHAEGFGCQPVCFVTVVSQYWTFWQILFTMFPVAVNDCALGTWNWTWEKGQRLLFAMRDCWKRKMLRERNDGEVCHIIAFRIEPLHSFFQGNWANSMPKHPQLLQSHVAWP